MPYGFSNRHGLASQLGGYATQETIALPTLFSFFCWLFDDRATGRGTGTDGRIVTRGSSTNLLMESTPATDLMYQASATTSFIFKRTPQNEWGSIGIKVDMGSSSNDPIIFVDNEKLTIGSGITQSGVDSSYHVAATTIILSGRSAGDRTFGGMLAHVAFWNVLLTDEEFELLHKGYYPDEIRPDALFFYCPMDTSEDIRNIVSGRILTRNEVGGLFIPDDVPNIIGLSRAKNRYNNFPGQALAAYQSRMWHVFQ